MLNREQISDQLATYRALASAGDEDAAWLAYKLARDHDLDPADWILEQFDAIAERVWKGPASKRLMLQPDSDVAGRLIDGMLKGKKRSKLVSASKKPGAPKAYPQSLSPSAAYTRLQRAAAHPTESRAVMVEILLSHHIDVPDSSVELVKVFSKFCGQRSRKKSSGRKR